MSRRASWWRVAVCAVAAAAITLAALALPLGSQAYADGAQQTPGLSATRMPRSGDAYVVGFCVDFPDYQFDEGDTVQALQNIIGAQADSSQPDVPLIVGDATSEYYPYVNLGSYFYRSSYGALSIRGKAYSYTAQHERSYYDNNMESLLLETLSAMDDEIDYSLFDGNADGYVDGVYLHFAGPDTGWATTFWSKAIEYKPKEADRLVLDGVTFSDYSSLHCASNTEAGVGTIIHETGHMLGLSDLYWPPSVSVKADRKGCLTWDMMDNTTGDFNGLSKMLFGWFDEAQITRVVANAQGITVTRGSEEIARVEASADGSSSYDLDLRSFTSDIVGDTGGIILVSNENQGTYASYYLIQYETPQGLSTVKYRDAVTGESKLIPDGFRVFRVHAQVDANGTFVHSRNILFNQVIELVDCDYADKHSDTMMGSESGGYGCMLQAGGKLDYSTCLSTNYYENIYQGFTGLTFEALSCDDDQGRIRIGYSPEGEPDFSGFTMTCDDPEGVTNEATLTFTASWGLARNADFTGPAATLYVNDETYGLYPAISGNTVSVTLNLKSTQIQEGDDIRLVFAKDAFIIGSKYGENVYSSEMSFDLSAKHQATIKADYTLDEITSQLSASCEVSGDTAYLAWVQSDGQGGFTPMLSQLPTSDPVKVSTREIAGLVLPSPFSGKATAFRMSIYAPDRALLTMVSSQSGSSLYWIDLKNASVIGSANASGTVKVCGFAADGSDSAYVLSMGALYRYRVAATGGIEQQKVPIDGSMSCYFEDFCDVGGGKIALLAGGSASSVHIVDVKALDAAIEAGTMMAEDLISQASLSHNLDVPFQVSGVTAGALLEDGGLLLALTGYDGADVRKAAQCLIRVDAQGNLVSSMNLGPKNPQVSAGSTSDTREYARIIVGGDGSVMMTRDQKAGQYISTHEVFIFALSDMAYCASNVECARFLSTNGGARGFWSDKLGWCVLDFNATDRVEHCYVLESPVVPPVGPEPTPEPEPDPAPVDPANLPRSGDPLVPLAPLAVAALALTALAASRGLSGGRA